MTAPPSIGVLLMAYGTPPTPGHIEAYYTHIRRGRPATPELLADLRSRYQAIGGTSPLLELTRAQALGVAASLGSGFHVELGMKHAEPFVEDGVAALAAKGVRRSVGLVLAPHYSRLSVGEYVARASAAADERGLQISFVEHWHRAPGYLGLLAASVREGLAPLPDSSTVLFTAHSLPARVLETGDPYPDQLRETAEDVAARVGLTDWEVAWQSAGRTPEPWLGPSLLEVLPSLAQRGRAGVLVCPAGFVSDHLEVLYDVDIEARRAAEAAGLAFARTPSPNSDPSFCATLADVIRRHLASGG